MLSCNNPPTSCPPRHGPWTYRPRNSHVSDAHENVNTCRERRRERKKIRWRVSRKMGEREKGWKKWRAIGDTKSSRTNRG